jgi:hypothetical protein
MKHILLECTIPGQNIIWNLVKSLWELKIEEWPDLQYGTILGCSLVKLTKDKNKDGGNRLFRIIVSESAYLMM